MLDYGYGNFGASAVMGSTIQVDKAQLNKLGFTGESINLLQELLNGGCKITLANLQSLGFNYGQSSLLKYMYDIVCGRVIIDSMESLAKHLRKMYGGTRRIGIQDLSISNITKIPRITFIVGIKDETFGMYNSSNYNGQDRMYEVQGVTSGRIVIKTKKRPRLKYGQSKKVDGVIEIIKELPNNELVLAVNKEYCKMCNRFIIIGSLRRPERHLGMAEILCIEGTTVFVYAQLAGRGEMARYREGTQRVYDYGFLPKAITPKLMACAQQIHKKLHGVESLIHPANMEYNLVDIDATRHLYDKIEDNVREDMESENYEEIVDDTFE